MANLTIGQLRVLLHKLHESNDDKVFAVWMPWHNSTVTVDVSGSLIVIPTQNAVYLEGAIRSIEP